MACDIKKKKRYSEKPDLKFKRTASSQGIENTAFVRVSV